jgi:hypothetical protein
MARKLKTFVTSVGFFDLAIAAPSMKAALDAWGLNANAFQQGFASQTNDENIIAAASAKPGVVLRRPVGTNESFREDAELPRDFTVPSIGGVAKVHAAPKSAQKPNVRKSKADKPATVDRSAIISFKKEKAKRDRERAKDQKAIERRRAKRALAIEKAESDLARAREEHERNLTSLEREKAKVDQRIERAQEKWETQRDALESAIDRARKT